MYEDIDIISGNKFKMVKLYHICSQKDSFYTTPPWLKVAFEFKQRGLKKLFSIYIVKYAPYKL